MSTPSRRMLERSIFYGFCHEKKQIEISILSRKKVPIDNQEVIHDGKFRLESIQFMFKVMNRPRPRVLIIFIAF